MKKQELQLSVRAYAKTLQVDEKAVRKAIEEGKIKKGYNKKIKKIIPSKADEEWGSLHKVAKPQRGVSKAKVAEKLELKKTVEKEKKATLKTNNDAKPPKGESITEKSYSYSELIDSILITPDLEYSEAIRRKEILGIAGERMKLEEQQGILLRKTDVDKNLFAIGDMLKKGLLNIPNRCIDDIMAAPNKIEASNILIMEITTVLNQFSSNLKPNGA